MSGFAERYPDQGLLLVMDELLDYLRTREQRAMILDLGFLRELGEVIELTPLRLLAGLAQRIIRALSVHRLTTSDIRAPIGPTVEELRNSLMLWTPLPEPDAEFLASTIQVALREVIRTVSGQFIAYNDENGQYYLDRPGISMSISCCRSPRVRPPSLPRRRPTR